MLRSIGQSLVAAAFIGTGIVSGTGSDATASWTMTGTPLSAILPAGHMPGLSESPDAAEPVVTARWSRAD